MEKIIERGRADGVFTGENPVRVVLKGNALPTQMKQAVHFKAIPHFKAPDLFRSLSTIDSPVARALQFAMLTVVRSKSILEMRWPQVDLGQKVWKIPASNMKSRQEFVVPLNREMIKILDHQKQFESEYVFQGRNLKSPMSNNSMRQLLQKTDKSKITVHGFRATFKTWAQEIPNAENDVSEMCLDHVIGTQTQRAYARSDLFAKRDSLMERWARYLETGVDTMVEELLVIDDNDR